MSGTVNQHYHNDNRCCFCGAEDDHECVMCPDYDGGAAMGMRPASEITDKATARPWRTLDFLVPSNAEGHQRGYFIAPVSILDGTDIAHLYINSSRPRATQEANAALIVTAVNSYDAMVDLARQCVGMNIFGSLENAAIRDKARDLLVRVGATKF